MHPLPSKDVTAAQSNSFRAAEICWTFGLTDQVWLGSDCNFCIVGPNVRQYISVEESVKCLIPASHLRFLM